MPLRLGCLARVPRLPNGWLKLRRCFERDFRFGSRVRRVPRSIYEHARDVARSRVGSETFEQSRHDRKRIEMKFAHLKRILRLGRLRLRGPRGAQDEFVLAATAQNLRRLAKLVSEPREIAGQLAPVPAT